MTSTCLFLTDLGCLRMRTPTDLHQTICLAIYIHSSLFVYSCILHLMTPAIPTDVFSFPTMTHLYDLIVSVLLVGICTVVGGLSLIHPGQAP